MTTQALTATQEETVTLSYTAQRLRTQLPVVISDAFFALTTFSLGSILLPGGENAWQAFPSYMLCLGVCGLATGMFRIVGVHPITELRQIVTGVLSSLAIMTIASLTLSADSPLAVLILAHLVLGISLPVLRAMIRSELARTSWWGVRCFVFGAGRRVNMLMDQHIKNRPTGLIPFGFVEPKLPKTCSTSMRSCYIGDLKLAQKVREKLNVHAAILHRYGRSGEELRNYMEQNLGAFSSVQIAADDGRLPTMSYHGYENQILNPVSQFLKRAMDVSVALSALILGFPILALLAVWSYISSPGPLFFGHERIGKGGSRFKVWKFRTMVVNAQEVLDEYLAANPEAQAEWDATYKLQNDPRITTVGHLLRKTSLDELPQLWNVIKGEMSLVGPRPIVTGEIERYADTYSTYLSVQPGITGFWQVSGRNLTTYDRRVELDRFYVRNWSIWFDLYVLGRTVKTVVCREGAF